MTPGQALDKALHWIAMGFCIMAGATIFLAIVELLLHFNPFTA